MSLALAALLAAGCSDREPLQKVAPREQRVVILHTNDIHGRVRPGGAVPGMAALAAHIKKSRADARAAGARVIVIDCGDFFQGTPEGDLTQGRLVVECMNAIGYDALCLGNHDLDLGPKVTEELKSLARFPFLGANVYRKGSRDPPDWLVSSVFFDDVNLEIAGLATSDMPNVTTARAREGLSFELEERVLERFPWRKDAIRVLATHIGAGRDRDLATKFRFAAILGGHSHSKVAEKIGDVQLLQSQCWGLLVGRLELTIRDGAVVGVTATHETVDRKVEDAGVKAIIAKYAPEIDKVMDEVVGELAQDLPSGSRDRVESSPLGNHLTDAMRASCDAAVALHNRTGIRSGLKKGVQRLRDIYTVSPFGNTIVVMTMSGADLRTLLEGSLGDGTRLLLEMSGAEIVFDAAADKGKRLVSVTVGGRPLDPAGSYRVATNSFLAEGGDGHSPFTRGKDRKDTLVTVLDAHRAALANERPLRYEFRNRIVAKP